jgi:hypothetical protein
MASSPSTQGKSNVFFGVGYLTYPSCLPLRNPSEADKLRKQHLLLRRRRSRHCDEKRKVGERWVRLPGHTRTFGRRSICGNELELSSKAFEAPSHGVLGGRERSWAVTS